MKQPISCMRLSHLGTVISDACVATAAVVQFGTVVCNSRVLFVCVNVEGITDFDLASFADGGVNITGLRLVDVLNKTVRDFIHERQERQSGRRMTTRNKDARHISVGPSQLFFCPFSFFCPALVCFLLFFRAMLCIARTIAVARCPSVRLSHAGISPKRLYHQTYSLSGRHVILVFVYERYENTLTETP